MDPPEIDSLPDMSFTKVLASEMGDEVVGIDLIVPEYVSTNVGSHYENFARLYSDPLQGTILQYGRNQYAIVYPGKFNG
jgi:hypothetical protein